MRVLEPCRRWQPSYYPFRHETLLNRFLEERALSSSHLAETCGNCLLQETAFICPMECPKGLRNGPCGGSTPEHCYVDKTRPCIWYKIYERAFKMGRQEMLLEVLPPLDWEKVGGGDLGRCGRAGQEEWAGKVMGGLLSGHKESGHDTWDGIFRPVRQPDWWQGDQQYHAPKYDRTGLGAGTRPARPASLWSPARSRRRCPSRPTN